MGSYYSLELLEAELQAIHEQKAAWVALRAQYADCSTADSRAVKQQYQAWKAAVAPRVHELSEAAASVANSR
jgi:hypothetical protein